MNTAKLEINSDGRRKKRPGLDEQKSTIKAAAVELFLEFGSRAVSIAEICKAADVSRPTFYRCYADKDELLSELYQSSVSRAVEETILPHFNNSKNNATWLHQALDSLYDLIFQQPELATLLFRESNDPSSPAYHIVNQAFDNFAEQLLKLKIHPHLPKAVNKTFLKSIMAANQWIVHEAINNGLNKKAIKNAKQASWLLASSIFTLKNNN